jgi:hypothetical protein
MAEDIAVQESSILSEAVTSSESAFWVVAKNEEIESLHKTWVEEIVVWLGTISRTMVQVFCVLWAIFMWLFCLFVALCR